jgi:4-methyl-5(b-hydroxyethyl)-thiazole monophosphate biosynthesis
MKRAVVLLADGFEEVEAITQIDFLRRAGIETIVLGVTGRDVVGGHDIRVNTDITVDEWADGFDAVVVPGGAEGARNIAANQEAMTLIERAMKDGKLVAAICASPGVVLGAGGLLGDHTFTCYPGFQKEATGGHFVEDRVVVDGRLITSRGPGTAAEFAEAIVTYLVGEDAAADLHRKTLQKA